MKLKILRLRPLVTSKSDAGLTRSVPKSSQEPTVVIDVLRAGLIFMFGTLRQDVSINM